MTEPDPRLLSLFANALDRPSGEARAAFVADACGDDALLRQRLDTLLAAHDRLDGFLESPETRGYDPATADRPVVPAGTVLAGRYKLLEEIGDGGMGTVWMAEQTEPVRRPVAVKLIKPGMDSKQVLARFEAERQALAMMDHPNIAKVHDAGTTHDGRPFFVMELVKGVPITKFCDAHKLTPRERLELFVPVCQAIQHAHQKGIIHRDIKPSNVLVAMYDDRPVPKIIDFGVAKATGIQLTEQTLHTGFGAVVGTFEYMSPEQANFNQLDVDTRSDIYSLGVLLYELLTGTTPLTRKKAGGAALLEILRLVREEEPPRPSTRLSTTVELPRIAALRGMEPSRLSKLVRGELDWIVMKALEKDRSRRYETANGLAADVQRYLADEPVQACPPSTAYRLRKYARRNRGTVLTSAMVGVTLIGGFIGTTWGLVRAANARAETTAEETRKEAAQTEARLNKRLADERHFASLQEQARAIRTSRQPGQRFKTLDVLRRATELAREMNLPVEKYDELRDTAIAALALPDLNPTGPWIPCPDDTVGLDFDDAHAIYARTDIKGNCTVRRVADDVEIHSMPGRGFHAGATLSRDGRFVAINHYLGGPPNQSVALELWELGSGTARKVFTEEKARFPAYHPHLPQIALAYENGAISVFELPTGRRLHFLPPDSLTREVGIALHPTEPVVAVCSYFGRPPVVQLRDLGTGKVIATLPQDTLPTCVEWSHDGRTLVVGTDLVGGVGASRTHLYDRTSLRKLKTLEGGTTVISVSYNRDGDRVATVDWGSTVTLFDFGSGQRLFAATTAIGHPRFSSDGRRLSGARRDDRVGFWEVGDGREYRTLARRNEPEKVNIEQATVSPNGRLVAVAMTDGIGLWDLAHGGELGFIPLPGVGGSKRVLFEPSGALLTLGPTGVSRWPVRTDPAAPERMIVGPPERVPLPIGHVLGQSRDGRVIVTCGRAINIVQPFAGGWLLHTDRSKPPIRLDPGGEMGWITVSPDGKWVVTVGFGEIKVWDSRDGRTVKRLAERGGGFVQFSPDGRWLSTDLDGGRLFEVGTWEPGPRVGGASTFSPDGRLVAVPTGTQIRLVEVATGRTLTTLEDPHLEPAVYPVFTPDGTQLIAPTNGKVKGVRVWDLRLIRRQLAEIGLDWDAPPYPQAAESGSARPPMIEVRLPPALSRLEKARQDIETYRRMLDRKPDHARACNNLAWTYLTAPEPLRNVKAAVPLAERAVKLEPANPVFTNTLGVAYYRDGRYSDAVRILQPNLAGQDDADLAHDLYFLAMSHHRLGETDIARAYFAWATRWERTQKDLRAEDVAELKEFRDEAATLMGLATEVLPPPQEYKEPRP